MSRPCWHRPNPGRSRAHVPPLARNRMPAGPGRARAGGRIEKRVTVTIIRWAADLDARNTDELTESLETAVAGRSDVIVDLSRVAYLDSESIRRLIDAHMRLKRNDKKLIVAGPLAPVREVIEVLKLHRVLRVAPCLQEALRILHGDHDKGGDSRA